MTLRQLERRLRDTLSDATPDADYEARLIILDAFGLTREGLLECYSADAEDAKSSVCMDIARRRAAGEPLQYILGKAYFMGLEFKVDPCVLIPRWDTENAASFAADVLPMGGRFADIGTGSGCIAVSLLKVRQGCVGDAYDISSGALDIAGQNALRHGVEGRLTLSLRDMREGAPDGAAYDLLISNPPYIPAADIEGLTADVRCEPILALDGGQDGLDFYRAIISGWARSLKSGGYFVFEIGLGQADSVQSMLGSICSSTGMVKDINGIERVVYGIKA